MVCVTRDATVRVRADRRGREVRSKAVALERAELPELGEGVWSWPVIGHPGRLLVGLASEVSLADLHVSLEGVGWGPLAERPQVWRLP